MSELNQRHIEVLFTENVSTQSYDTKYATLIVEKELLTYYSLVRITFRFKANEGYDLQFENIVIHIQNETSEITISPDKSKVAVIPLDPATRHIITFKGEKSDSSKNKTNRSSTQSSSN